MFLGHLSHPVNVTTQQWPFKMVFVPGSLLFQSLCKFQPRQLLNVDFVHTLHYEHHRQKNVVQHKVTNTLQERLSVCLPLSIFFSAPKTEGAETGEEFFERVSILPRQTNI